MSVHNHLTFKRTNNLWWADSNERTSSLGDIRLNINEREHGKRTIQLTTTLCPIPK